jgi:hypothetical protein
MLASRLLQLQSKDTELGGKVKELRQETNRLLMIALQRRMALIEDTLNQILVHCLEHRVNVDVNGVARDSFLLSYESKSLTGREH